MDVKALKRQNCVPVTWDGSKKKPVPFLHYKIMVLCSISLFGAGILVLFDCFLTFYYMRNPNVYTSFLLDNFDIRDNSTMYNEKKDIIGKLNSNSEKLELVKNPNKFMEALYNEELEYMDFYYYVFYNIENNSQKINRFFINSLIFAFFEIIAAIFAFQIRFPEYDWAVDMNRLIYFESFANVSCISNLFIWLFINFSQEFHFFIYSSGHEFIHYASIVFSTISSIIKVYLFFISFNDYFTNIPLVRPKNIDD